MKLKVKALKLAIDEFTKGTPIDIEVQVVAREENFEDGKLCDCVSFTTVYVEKHNDYENLKTDTTVTKTIEIFPESENQPPKITVTRTRNIG